MLASCRCRLIPALCALLWLTSPAMAESIWDLVNHESRYSVDLPRATAMLDKNPRLAKATDRSGNTVLHHLVGYYASGDWQSFVQLLLDSGASINARNGAGETPLHLAAGRYGESNVIGEEFGGLIGGLKGLDFLVAHGADANAQDKRGQTPADVAAAESKWASATRMLNLGGTFHTFRLDPQGKEAAELLRDAVVRHETGQSDMRALTYLMKECHCTVTAMLTVKVGGVSIKDATLLHYAALRGTRESAQMLLDAGLDLQARAYGGVSALHFAACGFDQGQGLIAFFVEKGLSVNDRDNAGATPLHWSAVALGSGHVMSMLVGLGADVNAKRNALVPGCEGYTALHEVIAKAQKDPKEEVMALLGNGANSNIRADNGKTPLHLAAEKGFLASARLLLARGADATIQDNDGWTPYSLAVAAGYQDLGSILAAAEAVQAVTGAAKQ